MTQPSTPMYLLADDAITMRYTFKPDVKPWYFSWMTFFIPKKIHSAILKVQEFGINSLGKPFVAVTFQRDEEDLNAEIVW